ncbi:MAG TPA: hypothetical protein VES89_00625 [Candidatus Competibacteraceae bacterium]|nr:hypothetical protein [Candidatus Competibacteraceae bacterium]
MTYLSPSQVGTWNGWTEPIPPPLSFSEIRHGLAVEIDRELATLPIHQQTVIIAVRHVGEDAWMVDILNRPPERGPYDGWEECIVDFDQYHDSIEANRYDAAKVLAYELMNKAFPGWQDPNYGKPEPDWEDWN